MLPRHRSCRDTHPRSRRAGNTLPAARLPGRSAQSPSLGHREPYRPVRRGAFLELIGLGEGSEGARRRPLESSLSHGSWPSSWRSARGWRCWSCAPATPRPTGAPSRPRASAISSASTSPAGRNGRTAPASMSPSSLAFASCAALPQTGFFVCQQHFPEEFHGAARRRCIPTGALAISGVVITHEAPGEIVEFLSGFVDAPPENLLRADSRSRRSNVSRPDAFFPDGSAPAPQGPKGMGSPPRASPSPTSRRRRPSSRSAVAPFTRHGEMLIVDAMGALLAFATN